MIKECGFKVSLQFPVNTVTDRLVFVDLCQGKIFCHFVVIEVFNIVIHGQYIVKKRNFNRVIKARDLFQGSPDNGNTQEGIRLVFLDPDLILIQLCYYVRFDSGR